MSELKKVKTSKSNLKKALAHLLYFKAITMHLLQVLQKILIVVECQLVPCFAYCNFQKKI